MKDITQMMEEDRTDRSSLESVDTGGLKSIADIARRIRSQEKLVESLESDLKKAKELLLELTDKEMPALLTELGLSKFILDDGASVTVKPTYGAYIRKADQQQAFSWLRERGYDDILKNVVTVQFGRGEDSQSDAFFLEASQKGLNATQDTKIHPQTLKAFVKERIEAGDSLPTELFGVHVGERAIIKQGK